MTRRTDQKFFLNICEWLKLLLQLVSQHGRTRDIETGNEQEEIDESNPRKNQQLTQEQIEKERLETAD